MFDIQVLFPKIVSPNPHPKCLKTSCEFDIPLEWARTKVSHFRRFYQTCLVRLGRYTFPPLDFGTDQKGGMSAIQSYHLISDVSRPQSQSHWPFQQVLCKQLSSSTSHRMLAADWPRAHASVQAPFLKGQTSAGFSKPLSGLRRSHVQCAVKTYIFGCTILQD